MAPIQARNVLQVSSAEALKTHSSAPSATDLGGSRDPRLVGLSYEAEKAATAQPASGEVAPMLQDGSPAAIQEAPLPLQATNQVGGIATSPALVLRLCALVLSRGLSFRP